MTEPEQQAPAVLVENMLLLRKEDFDDLLDRAAMTTLFLVEAKFSVR